MRKPMKTAASSILAGGLLLAAACSGGGSATESETAADEPSAELATTAQFCDEAQALYDQFVTAGVSDPTSPAVQEVFAEAKRLTPPDVIAEDWNTILASLEPLVTGQVNLQDPAALEQVNQQAVANAAAYERVGTYTNETCGIGATSTTVP